METLALVHSYIAYEEPVSELKVKSFDQLGLKIPSSAWVGIAGLAVAVSVMTIPAQAQAALVSTNGGRLNVRSGPGLGYYVIDKLHNGKKVRTTSHSVNGWVKLKHGGWVASQWLSYDVAAAPSYYPKTHHKHSHCNRCKH